LLRSDPRADAPFGSQTGRLGPFDSPNDHPSISAVGVVGVGVGFHDLALKVAKWRRSRRPARFARRFSVFVVLVVVGVAVEGVASS
jgi:hypothetical protein